MKKRIQYIQILRIIACIGVFSVHFGNLMNFQGILRKITDFGKNMGFICFSLLVVLQVFYLQKVIQQ